MVSAIFQRSASAARLTGLVLDSTDKEDSMSNTVATDRAQAARATNIALWVLQAVLKLTGSPEMVELFATAGAGQWLRYLVGTLEVAGAVGLLVPRLSGLAALGLAGLMVGATATNLFVLGESPWLPIGLLLASILIAWGRRSRTRALAARLTR
jgi:putative oxidoreductase